MCCCFMLSSLRWDRSFLLRSAPQRAHKYLKPTFPVWSVMHEDYENITEVNLLLTELSRVQSTSQQVEEAIFP